MHSNQPALLSTTCTLSWRKWCKIATFFFAFSLQKPFYRWVENNFRSLLSISSLNTTLTSFQPLKRSQTRFCVQNRKSIYYVVSSQTVFFLLFNSKLMVNEIKLSWHTLEEGIKLRLTEEKCSRFFFCFLLVHILYAPLADWWKKSSSIIKNTEL